MPIESGEFVIPFALAELPPACERLPTRFLTLAAASEAAHALDTPYLIERNVVLQLPPTRGRKKGQPPPEGQTEETYQVIRCSAVIQDAVQRDMQARITAARQILYSEALGDRTIPLEARTVLAVWLELASWRPKPLSPEEADKKRQADTKRWRKQEREWKRRQEAWDRELAALEAAHAARQRLAAEAIAHGIASPWKNTPEDQQWRCEERHRMLEEYKAKDRQQQREEQHRQQPERQAFLTREAILGGIACTWRPSLAVVTALALEQGLACPWPDPAAAAHPRGRTALSPHNMQRLQKIITTHRRRNTP